MRVLTQVGLAAKAGAYPRELSGGEQQRVAIARALMLEPPLLVADEPTGNLDSETAAHILGLLFGLARERGTTLVMATHSEDAARHASRRVVLHDGRIANDDLAKRVSLSDDTLGGRR
jgi:putative ABC transport system ATP-binding protein